VNLRVKDEIFKHDDRSYQITITELIADVPTKRTEFLSLLDYSMEKAKSK
jgi:hypothetical protein